MIDALIAGKVSTKPSKRIGNNNNAFVTIRVTALSKDGDQINIGVIAFDHAVGNTLMALDVGDSISVTGSIAPKVWTSNDGLIKATIDMVATAVLSPYQISQKCEAMD